MSKQKLEIDFPDEKTIELQIQKIVSEGIRPKESFYLYLKEMYKKIGLKHLFHDTTEIAFTVFVALSILGLFLMGAAERPRVQEGSVYSFVFILSPLVYFAMALLSFINTRLHDTYSIEMTCRYNMYQLAAFRMLVFSVLSILANTGVIYLVSVIYEELNFLMAFMISTTSLFIFSTMFLYGMMRSNTKMTKSLMIGGWLFSNFLLVVYSGEFYDLLLVHIPTYIYGVVILSCILIYIKNLKKLAFSGKLEGVK